MISPGGFALTRSPIKLTYVITDLKVGGVPLHLYRLATRLSRETFRVRVISLADAGPVGEQLREQGIEVQACGARSALDVRALFRLWKYLRAESPDILHALLFHANIAGRIVGPLAGVPIRRIICEIQTVEVERRWHLPVDGLTCWLCRFEVGNSPSVIEHLHRAARIPRSRLRCEWSGVDVARFASAEPADRAALGVRDDEKLLLWTGRLDPVKGFEVMLAACAALKTQYAFKFLIVGDGPYRPTVERLIEQHGLGEHVRLLGQRQDVPSLLRAADMFIFGSRTEGLPNSLLEAMAAGLPIVAPDVPGCRELIRHLDTGMRVRPDSAEEMTQAITMLLGNPRLAVELGQRALAYARCQFDVSAWAGRWIDLYTSVLGLGDSP